MSDKQSELNLYAKIISYLTYVVAPVFLGNMVFWSHNVLTGREPSKRARFAIFAGSLGMASGVHYICNAWNWQKAEWVVVWFCSIFAEHFLKFLYFELWDIIKEWMSTAAKQTLERLNKNK